MSRTADLPIWIKKRLNSHPVEFHSESGSGIIPDPGVEIPPNTNTNTSFWAKNPDLDPDELDADLQSWITDSF
jgi:hypothetical protein